MSSKTQTSASVASSDSERQPLEKRCPLQERDFSTVYIGYDSGIDVEGLDSTGNWQFQLN